MNHKHIVTLRLNPEQYATLMKICHQQAATASEVCRTALGQLVKDFYHHDHDHYDPADVEAFSGPDILRVRYTP